MLLINLIVVLDNYFPDAEFLLNLRDLIDILKKSSMKRILVRLCKYIHDVT